MKSGADFLAFYRSTLVPVMESLDRERKKITKTIYLAASIAIILFLIIIAVAILSGKPLMKVQAVDNQGNPIEEVNNQGDKSAQSPDVVGILFLTIIAGGIGHFFWYIPKSKELSSRFKSEVIQKMVKFVDEGLHYQSAHGISQSEFMQSKIFLTSGDRYMSEDLVSGTLGSTAIRFSEVHAQRREKRRDGDSGSARTEYVTIYRGILFIADFNKHFKGRTVVLADVAESTFGSFGTMFQRMNQMRDPLIKLENPEFEKAFAVYGTDPVEAHYILSPALMQRIMAFRSKSGKIELSFVDSKLFVSIPTSENLFEYRIFGNSTNYTHLDKYHDYLLLITGIVEELNLNNRIWTKV